MTKRRSLIDAGVWLAIPCFKVRQEIDSVLRATPPWIEGVVVVDDSCPQGAGAYVENAYKDDARIVVVRHEKNQGVGAATMRGYSEAIRRGARIIVKVDGDGQMDLSRLPALILPIWSGAADYTKGNRFSSTSHIESMPTIRIIGNAALSILTKISSGYWNVFDPTNGYTAIEARVAQELLSKKIARRFFFESDLLYHLGTLRAVVQDVAMPARYGTEISNLKIWREMPAFLWGHARNTVKRFAGQYVSRDFSIASIEFMLGVGLLTWGVVGGLLYWLTEASPLRPASPGLVMGVALPIILGLQLFLSALNFDVLNVPKEPIAPGLRGLDEFGEEAVSAPVVIATNTKI